jgi:hypothetical protein
LNAGQPCHLRYFFFPSAIDRSSTGGQAIKMSADVGSKREKRLYGTDHAKFNITMPPPTMWMNMGYWKHTEDFPTACRSLLDEVLQAARILQAPEDDSKETTSRSLSIIDLGFGCGDQSLHLRNVLGAQAQEAVSVQNDRFLSSYVGITLDRDQFEIAQCCLDRENLADRGPSMKLHCADASSQENWDVELKDDIASACKALDGSDHENWILGLDTLYHFQPSKWPIINYASTTLGASLMAYDLCLSDNLSLWHRLILRLMAFLGHSPFLNWATVDGYRDQLVAAGYDKDKIEIIDISEHVFRPLARFIRRRDVELKHYGISSGMGRFRHGAAMFDWWGRAGVVKGCIVIARK